MIKAHSYAWVTGSTISVMQNLTGRTWTYASLKRNLSIFLVMFLSTGLAFCQNTETEPATETPQESLANDDYELVRAFPVKGQYLSTDFIKSAYVVNDKDQVLKFDSLGRLSGIFNENKYGPVAQIDATAPFNVLVFFKDFNTIIAADMTMSMKHLYKLENIDINEISAVCMSYDNNIWIFDQAENKLKKIAKNYDVLHESEDVSQILGLNISPTFMVEREKMIFVIDPESGILTFDMFGNYYRTFPISGVESIQVLKGNFVYYAEGEMHSFDPRTMKTNKILIPEIENTQSVYIQQDLVYILTDKEIQIYRLK